MAFLKTNDMHYSCLIPSLVKAVNCQSYLEIGIRRGYTLRKVRKIVPRVVGIDIVDPNIPDIRNQDIELYIGTSDSFFEKNDELFDVMFIDGDHNFVQVLKDFENSLKILNKDGMIILHDTDPRAIQFLDPKLSHDAYRIVDHILQQKNLDIVTLPVGSPGLSLVRRKEDRRILSMNH